MSVLDIVTARRYPEKSRGLATRPPDLIIVFVSPLPREIERSGDSQTCRFGINTRRYLEKSRGLATFVLGIRLLIWSRRYPEKSRGLATKRSGIFVFFCRRNPEKSRGLALQRAFASYGLFRAG